MRITFTTIAAILLLFPASTHSPAAATEEPSIQTPPPVAQNAYPSHPWTQNDAAPYRAMLRSIAASKGLPEAKIREIEGTIGGDQTNKLCPNGESGWNPDAVGDGNTSFGLVQINLPWHPEITREQAYDPEFAINFIVDEFLKGNEHLWTCWRALYEVPIPSPAP